MVSVFLVGAVSMEKVGIYYLNYFMTNRLIHIELRSMGSEYEVEIKVSVFLSLPCDAWLNFLITKCVPLNL